MIKSRIVSSGEEVLVVGFDNEYGPALCEFLTSDGRLRCEFYDYFDLKINNRLFNLPPTVLSEKNCTKKDAADRKKKTYKRKNMFAVLDDGNRINRKEFKTLKQAFSYIRQKGVENAELLYKLDFGYRPLIECGEIVVLPSCVKNDRVSYNTLKKMTKELQKL